MQIDNIDLQVTKATFTVDVIFPSITFTSKQDLNRTGLRFNFVNIYSKTTRLYIEIRMRALSLRQRRTG